MSKRYVQYSLLLLLVMLNNGCQYFAYATEVLIGPKTRAKYVLKQVPTVILFDDPSEQLVNPMLASLFVQRVYFDLIQHKALTRKQTIAYAAVQELKARMGDAFARTAIDRIGQEVNAQQVIYVNLVSLRLEADPGILNPQMVVGIKVVDVQQGKRVFPPLAASSNLDNIAASHQGYLLAVQLPQTLKLDIDQGTRTILLRQLVNQLGIKVAQLFYAYTPSRR